MLFNFTIHGFFEGNDWKSWVNSWPESVQWETGLWCSCLEFVFRDTVRNWLSILVESRRRYRVEKKLWCHPLTGNFIFFCDGPGWELIAYKKWVLKVIGLESFAFKFVIVSLPLYCVYTCLNVSWMTNAYLSLVFVFVIILK